MLVTTATPVSIGLKLRMPPSPHDKEYIFRVADYRFLRWDRQYLVTSNIPLRRAYDRSQWNDTCCDPADLGAVPDGVDYFSCIEVDGDDALNV